MDKQLAEILFFIMFGVSISASATNVIKSILPFGVGNLIKDGIRVFLVRVFFITSMVLLSSIGLILALKFCKTIEPKNVFIDLINVLIILLLATIPWLCDHITRILFLPFGKLVTIREPEFKGVDAIFIAIYFTLITILYLIRTLCLFIINRN